MPRRSPPCSSRPKPRWGSAFHAQPTSPGIGSVHVDLLPNEPEALGVLALLQYCEARKPQVEEAERLLSLAAACRRPGRFQLEAAIPSAHVERARGGHVDGAAIALLYEGLVQLAPTLGALIGRAAAIADARGPAAGLALLEAIPRSAVESYQPYWAARAHFCRQLGRAHDAREVFGAAIRLPEDGAVREFLERMAESPSV